MLPFARRPALAVAVVLATTCCDLVNAFVPSAPLRLAGARPGLSPVQCAGGASCLVRGQRAGAGGLSMALADRPSGGGDNDNDAGWCADGGIIDAAVPAEVSQRELRLCLLMHDMQNAVQEERFDEAARIKKEVDSLRSRLLRKLEAKIWRQVEKMRCSHQKELKSSEVARAQHELAAALAVEDYHRASGAQRALEVLRARTYNSARSRLKRFIARRLQWLWLEASICSRVSTMRLLDANARRDAKTRWQLELAQAIQEEDYASAAVARDELNAELLSRDIKAMHQNLDTQLRGQRALVESQRLPRAGRVEAMLEAAIKCDDFERAARVSGVLRRLEMRKVWASLHSHLREHTPDALHSHLREHTPDGHEAEVRSGARLGAKVVRGYGGVMEPWMQAHRERLDARLQEALAAEDYGAAAEAQAAMLAGDEVARLGAELQSAEARQDFARASRIQVRLVSIYTSTLSGPLLSAMGFYNQSRAPMNGVSDARMPGDNDANFARRRRRHRRQSRVSKKPLTDAEASVILRRRQADSGSKQGSKTRGGRDQAWSSATHRAQAGVKHGVAKTRRWDTAGRDGGAGLAGAPRPEAGTGFEVGQVVRHKSKGYRGIVLGSTHVCAAPPHWVWKHGIDALARGRDQCFYHIIPDTRDVHLRAPARPEEHVVPHAHTAQVAEERQTLRGVGSQHGDAVLSKGGTDASKALWIGDCSPAFVCASDVYDPHPLMLTGYVAEDELEALEAGEDGGMKQHDGLVAAARGPPRTRDLLRGAWHGLLCVLGRPLAPVEHPALSYYFHDVHVTRSYCPEKGPGYLAPKSSVGDLVFFHMPEWL